MSFEPSLAQIIVSCKSAFIDGSSNVSISISVLFSLLTIVLVMKCRDCTSNLELTKDGNTMRFSTKRALFPQPKTSQMT